MTDCKNSGEMNKSFEQFRVGTLSGEQIFRFLSASEVEVTRCHCFDDGREWALVLKAKSQALLQGLGLQREFILIVTNYPDFQPRTLKHRQAVETSVQTPGRFEEITIVVSPDANLREILAKIEHAGQALMGISPSEIADAMAEGLPSIRFRKILQERLFARDFFDRSGPVGGPDFFGRDKVLQDIGGLLAGGSHVGLYGLRKVGKTSMIKALLARKEQLCPNVDLVHIDLLSVAPVNRTYQYLFFEIARALKSLGHRTNCLPANGRFDSITDIVTFERAFDSDFRQALTELQKVRRRFTLVLDEIERLFPSADQRTGFGGYDVFLEYIRGISQAAGPLSLLVVGVNPHVSEAECLGKRQNPMFGFFTTRYAPPMAIDEVTDMVQRLGRLSGVRFDHDAVQAVFDSVGGHPFLIRRYCSLLIHDRARPTQITAKDVADSEENFLRRETSIFAELISVVKDYYPDEFKILHRIALDDRIPSDAVNRRILAHLEGYQLVQVCDGFVHMPYRLMHKWMLGVTRRVAAEVSEPIVAFSGASQAEPSTIDCPLVRETLGDLELTLRKKIRTVLEARWGGQADKRIRAAIGEDATAKAEKAIANSLRFRSEAGEEEILDFLYIGDLKSIILGHEWQEFRLIFSNKGETERNLQTVAGCRNDLQHYRTPSNLELLKAYVAAQELLKTLQHE